MTGSQLNEASIRLRPAVSIELPHIPHLANLVEVELRCHELVAIARCLRDELSARITEIALTVELTNTPRLLIADTVDRADKERIRDRVCGLLELPEILRQSGNRRRRIEDDLRPVEPELAR